MTAHYYTYCHYIISQSIFQQDIKCFVLVLILSNSSKVYLRNEAKFPEKVFMLLNFEILQTNVAPYFGIFYRTKVNIIEIKDALFMVAILCKFYTKLYPIEYRVKGCMLYPWTILTSKWCMCF